MRAIARVKRCCGDGLLPRSHLLKHEFRKYTCPPANTSGCGNTLADQGFRPPGGYPTLRPPKRARGDVRVETPAGGLAT